MTASGDTPGPPPPPPRRRPTVPSPRPVPEINRILGPLFAAKGVLTAASALAVMAVLPWITTSLRTAIAETGATVPAAVAFVLERPWILFAFALQALASGVLMVVTRRGRAVNLAFSSVSLLVLVLFLGLSLMIIVRSIAGAAAGP